MKEKTLFKLSLIIIIIGLIILFFVSENIEIDEKAISKINAENLDEHVKLTGKITNIYQTDKVTILELEKPESITVVIFEKMNLNKDDLVEIIGTVEEYEGKMEVIGQRVRVIY